MSRLFDILNDVTYKKQNLVKDDEGILNDYDSFVINRFLSQHPDTLILSNEMNFHSHIDSQMQYDFLLNSIRKNFRQNSKWDKVEVDSNAALVKEYFNYSERKAREALQILTSSELEDIKGYLYKGGVGKNYG